MDVKAVSSAFELLTASESYGDEMESPDESHGVSGEVPTSQMQQLCCVLAAACKATAVLPTHHWEGNFTWCQTGRDYVNGASVNN